jgi:hypothetical protein
MQVNKKIWESGKWGQVGKQIQDIQRQNFSDNDCTQTRNHKEEWIAALNEPVVPFGVQNPRASQTHHRKHCCQHKSIWLHWFLWGRGGNKEEEGRLLHRLAYEAVLLYVQ